MFDLEHPRAVARRRSPTYVRSWSLRDLHAVAMSFDRERRHHDLSDRQEWLFDGIISELEYRRRWGIRHHQRSVCSCWLCFGPFPELEERPQGPLV